MQSNHSNNNGKGRVLFWGALCVALAMAAPAAFAAPAETVLHTFCLSGNPCSDGSTPNAGLIGDSSGNLYGTASVGGVGTGVVFKLAPDGTETVLHTFAFDGSDGANPQAGLNRDSKGNLYGTTFGGGTGGGGCTGNGCGVVFKLAPDGTYTVLHNLTASGGNFAAAGLIADSKGNLYGTTVNGGAAGSGVVFKLTPGGTYTVLHSFKGFPGDGAFPEAGLYRDSNGNLYGTTVNGGSGCGAPGCGVLFKLAPPVPPAKKWIETVLHSFCPGGPPPPCSDGRNPQGGLIADSSGNLYGTASAGGNATNTGTVFKLAPGGTYTVLYSFCPSNRNPCPDGNTPLAGLIADSKGNLYGTTKAGGAGGQGVVFKLTPGGTETVLYSFCPSVLSCSDGRTPFAGLFADSKGNLYGTTHFGGSTLGCGAGCGVVFKLAHTGFALPIPFAAFSGTRAIDVDRIPIP